MHRTAVTGKKSPRSTHAPAAVHDMKTHELMAHHLTHATQNSDRLKPIRLPATQKQNHVLQLRANVKWLFWSSKHCEVSKDHHSKDPVPSQLSFLSLRGFKRNPKLYRKIKKQNWSKLTIMAISPSQSFAERDNKNCWLFAYNPSIAFEKVVYREKVTQYVGETLILLENSQKEELHHRRWSRDPGAPAQPITQRRFA